MWVVVGAFVGVVEPFDELADVCPLGVVAADATGLTVPEVFIGFCAPFCGVTCTVDPTGLAAADAVVDVIPDGVADEPSLEGPDTDLMTFGTGTFAGVFGIAATGVTVVLLVGVLGVVITGVPGGLLFAVGTSDTLPVLGFVTDAVCVITDVLTVLGFVTVAVFPLGVLLVVLFGFVVVVAGVLAVMLDGMPCVMLGLTVCGMFCTCGFNVC